MRSIARITTGNTTTSMPARTEYELQTLFDFIGEAARRHGVTRLQVGGTSCLATPLIGGPTLYCVHCNHPIRIALDALRGHRICIKCAWPRLADRRMGDLGTPLPSAAGLH